MLIFIKGVLLGLGEWKKVLIIGDKIFLNLFEVVGGVIGDIIVFFCVVIVFKVVIVGEIDLEIVLFWLEEGNEWRLLSKVFLCIISFKFLFFKVNFEIFVWFIVVNSF